MDRKDVRASVRAEPDNPNGWYELGRIMAMEGETEKARDCFDRAVALDLANKRGTTEDAPDPTLPDWL